MAQLDPNLVLNGEPPRLLDEWQEVPALWDAVRHSVDETAANLKCCCILWQGMKVHLPAIIL